MVVSEGLVSDGAVPVMLVSDVFVSDKAVPVELGPMIGDPGMVGID